MKTSIKSIAAAAFLAFVACLAPTTASAQKGEKCVGGDLSFITKNNSLGADIFFQYSFSEHLRIVPRVGCIFRHENLDAFVLDCDVQFPFAVNTQKFRIYPLVGLDYSSWTAHVYDKINDKDVTARDARFGINAGAGCEYFIKKNVKLNFEIKYTMTQHVSTAKLAFGAAYMF